MGSSHVMSSRLSYLTKYQLSSLIHMTVFDDIFKLVVMMAALKLSELKRNLEPAFSAKYGGAFTVRTPFILCEGLNSR
jgi:hypothetical protein